MIIYQQFAGLITLYVIIPQSSGQARAIQARWDDKSQTILPMSDKVYPSMATQNAPDGSVPVVPTSDITYRLVEPTTDAFITYYNAVSRYITDNPL